MGGELSYVRVGLPDGRSVRLAPGAVIGRLSSAELRFSDPNVSEAHALVSLRGRQLKLLALRRWFEVGGQRVNEVVLAVGQHLQLAPGVVLAVEEVYVAPGVLALAGLDDAPYELSAAVHSLVRRDGALIAEARYVPDALGYVSSATDGWVVRTADGTEQDLSDGVRFEVDGAWIEVVTVDIGGGRSTNHVAGSPPLRIVTRFDTVHLHPDGRPSVVLTGISARIVSELGAFGAPVPWSMVAREIWGADADERVMRQNWDRNMRSLRARLRSVGIRDDLVRPDGHGNTELFLLPDDALVDEG
ncbi:MAG: hypothetical protein ABMB14_11950 [Myxococcota bacterium]